MVVLATASTVGSAEEHFSDGNIHVFILIPCDESHGDAEGCDFDTVDAMDQSDGRAFRLERNGSEHRVLHSTPWVVLN